jgi:ankyrin repeat protein
MDLAVQTKSTEMVNELRKRGLSAQDQAAEALIPLPGGIEEAKALLERVEAPRPTHQKIEQSKHDHSKKFREILKQGDYNLFSKFEEVGGDLLAYGGYRLDTGLHALVERGHVELLEEFAEKTARLDEKKNMETEDNPGTLLSHACEQPLPRLEIIKVLVEKGKVNVNHISDRYGYTYKGEKATALHLLAAGSRFWNIEALEYLLDHGADIEARNRNGDTPLMAAVGSDYPNGFWKEKTMRVLLDRGANPNALNKNLQTCLNMADGAIVVRLLLHHGADITIGKIPPLTSAVVAMDTDAAKLLLEAGADPNTGDPLYQATKHIDTEENDDPFLGQQQTDMISLLLEYGANPFAPQDDNFPVLQTTIEEHGVLDQFLELFNFPVELSGHGGRTPLISSCYPTLIPPPPFYEYNKPKPKPVCTPTAALVLIRKGANVNAKDDQGRTALHWICTMQDELDERHRSVVKALVETSPDLVHQQDNEGFKPLHLAVAGSHTHVWIIHYLISCGCNPNEPDPAGNTILHYLAPQLLGEKTKALATAERFKHFLSLEVPIDHLNNLGETPLFRFMCKSWNGTTKVGESHPTYAIANDITHAKALPIFLGAGADLQVRNSQGEGLLHVTAKRWRKKEYIEGDQKADMLGIFKELMAKGLDPRAEDAKCRTAIDVAVASLNSFLVDLFGQKERKMGEKKEVVVTDTESDGDGSDDPDVESDEEWW